jgi:hypothetical protein
MLDTLKAVLSGCVKTPLDFDTIALFDIEYIFSQIRAKSVGENVEIIVRCDVCPEENEKARVKLTFDLTKLEVNIPENHSKKIALFDDVGVMMRYPSLEVIQLIDTLDISDAESIFNIILKCVDYIYDAEQVYYAKDTNEAELRGFFENLTAEQFQSVQAFFETMPKLRKEVSYDCPVCGHHHDKVLEGLSSFF